NTTSSTPTLSDVTHNLSVSFPRNFSLDYALVTPGHATLLLDEVLVLDDDVLGITYSNNWRPPKRLPNGTERLSISYTLDGYKTQQDYYPGSQTQTNFLWFANTMLEGRMGSQRVSFPDPHNFSLNHALVTPGNATRLLEDVLVLDNDVLDIVDSSNWRRNTSSYIIPVSQGQRQLSLTPLNGVNHVAQLTLIPTFAKFDFTRRLPSPLPLPPPRLPPAQAHEYTSMPPLYDSQNGTERLSISHTFDGYKTQRDY
ncbi:hypothetical protein DXG01_012567, partial [Tephrocybe rancida]